MSSHSKDPFVPGDRVTWRSPQGEISGTVEKKLVEPVEIKGHHVAASPTHSEYLVASEKTGAKAAHTPDSLEKR